MDYSKWSDCPPRTPIGRADALFGSHELEERLNLPQLYPFAQRVVSRSWLDVFTNEETGQFISKELKRAQMNRDDVISAMVRIRTAGDALEVLVGKQDWPMPTYQDLLNGV